MSSLEERVGEIYNNKSYYGIDFEPLYADRELIRRTLLLDLKYDNYYVGDLAKAKMLHDFVGKNISAELSERECSNGRFPRRYYFKTARETFRLRKGMCVDVAILYTTMARILGYESNVVNVFEDDNGDEIGHFCSWIKYNSELILVDTTDYNGFGIKHKRFTPYDDDRLIEYYKDIMLKANKRNLSTAARNKNRIMEEDYSNSITKSKSIKVDRSIESYEYKPIKKSEYEHIIKSHNRRRNKGYYLLSSLAIISALSLGVYKYNTEYPKNNKEESLTTKAARNLKYIYHDKKVTIKENYTPEEENYILLRYLEELKKGIK